MLGKKAILFNISFSNELIRDFVISTNVFGHLKKCLWLFLSYLAAFHSLSCKWTSKARYGS